jgi:hypothetical protein
MSVFECMACGNRFEGPEGFCLDCEPPEEVLFLDKAQVDLSLEDSNGEPKELVLPSGNLPHSLFYREMLT